MFESSVLERFGEGDLIPLADLADHVGLNRGTQNYAIRTKVIIPADKRGPHGRYLLTRDETLLILAAAAISISIGVALVTILRTLRETGARVTDGSLTIPLNKLT